MAGPLGSAPSILLAAGLGAAASTALEPVFEPARQEAWKNNPFRVNDPATYEGGELSIEIGNVAIPFKGAPGEAIVYPSTTLHEVVPVRSGERLVSITFIESYIADEHQRTQVHELNEIAALEGLTMKWESRVRLDVVRQNLMRMWSTT